MNDERLGRAAGQWLREIDSPLPDLDTSVQHAMEQVRGTGQVHRWWPFPAYHRKANAPTVTDTTALLPSPIPARNGHTPTVIGRTQFMFSPAKSLIVGAIVFGIGGVYLITQPFDHQQGGSVPGAEMQPPPASTAFTSTYIWSDRSNPGSTTEYDDGTIVYVGQGWLFYSLESSDPRFAGPLVLTKTDIVHPDAGGGINVGGYRIETDEGAWQQVPTAGVGFDEDAARWESHLPADNIQFWTFIGEGAYEGLTAVVRETWWPGGGNAETIRFDGYILEGDLWDAPEPWVP